MFVTCLLLFAARLGSQEPAYSNPYDINNIQVYYNIIHYSMRDCGRPSLARAGDSSAAAGGEGHIAQIQPLS